MCKRKMRFVLLASLLALTTLAQAGKGMKGEQLTGDAILNLIGNQDVHWEVRRYIERIGDWRDFTVSVKYQLEEGQTKGKMIGNNLTNGKTDVGEWWINQEGRFCRKWNKWSKGKKACRIITLDEKGKLRSYEEKKEGKYSLSAKGKIQN